MADYVLAIKKDKDFLRDRSDEIVLSLLDEPRVTGIINDLKDTLKANKNLVALAAPQLGKKERIFAIKFANGDIKAFINPAIVRTNNMHLSREKQIGLDDEEEYLIPRADEVFATYQTPTMMADKCDMNKFTGPVAEVFQQMNDLLNGILLEDYGMIILPGFDEASQEEKEEIIKMYMESLGTKKDKIEEVINSNPESRDMNKAIEFMTKLQLGEIETVPLTEDEIKELKEKQEKRNGKDI